MSNNTPFVPDTALTAIALGFRNNDFIADMVAPRVGVVEETFRWTEFDTEDSFTIPNTLVGRKGAPNEVEFGSTEHTDSVKDYGLSDVIPQTDIAKAANHPAINPEGRAVTKLRELIALDREKRVAQQIMSAGSYNHSEVISGADQWTATTGNPIIQISDAKEVPLVTPNTLVLGRTEALALRRNPNIVKAYNGSDGNQGLVPMSFIRELFELDNIYVGQARHNIARKGQAGDYQRLWTGGAALLYIKPAAQLTDDVTFMLTAEWNGPVAGRNVLPGGRNGVGTRGGVEVIVGDSVKEVLVSSEAGYFLQGVA